MSTTIAYPADGTLPIGSIPLKLVQAHVDAEHGNSIPGILETLSSWDTYFALLATVGGERLLDFAEDMAAAEEYYVRTRSAALLESSVHLKDVTASWYCLVESVGHLRHVGEIL